MCIDNLPYNHISSDVKQECNPWAKTTAIAERCLQATVASVKSAWEEEFASYRLTGQCLKSGYSAADLRTLGHFTGIFIKIIYGTSWPREIKIEIKK